MERLGGERLKRGKTYANTGKVLSIKYEKEKILAKVAGNYRPFYSVEIELNKLKDSAVDLIETILEENPLIAVDLSLGKLSPDLQRLTESRGIRLLPSTWLEIRAKCNCPDYGDPCKHQAAVFYMMANELDKDPLMLLRLRGLPESFFKRKDIKIDDGKTLKSLVSKVLSAPDLEPNAEKNYNQSFPSLEFKISKLLSLLTANPSFEQSFDFKNFLESFYAQAAININNLFSENFDIEKEAVKADYKITLNTQANSYLYFFIVSRMEDEFEDVFSVLNYDQQSYKEFLDFSLNTDLNELAPRKAFLLLLVQTAVELIKAGLFIPDLVFGAEDSFTVRYVPLLIDDNLKARLKVLREIFPDDLIKLEGKPFNKDVLEELLSFFITNLLHNSLINVRSIYSSKIASAFIFDYQYVPSSFSEKNTGKALLNWLSKLSIQKANISPLIRIEDKSENELYLDVEVFNRAQPLVSMLSLRDLHFNPKPQYYSETKEEIINSINRQLAIAAEYIPELNQIINSKGEALPRIDLNRVAELLSNSRFVLELLGIQFILPKALQKILKPRLSVSAKGKSSNTLSNLSMENLLKFSYEISLGDTKISLAEFRKLVKSTTNLVKFNDEYVMLDPSEIDSLLNQAKKPLPEITRAIDVLHYGLAREINGIEINASKDLESFIKMLTKTEKVSIPSNLNAQLRPYQERGFKWLYSNFKKNLGSCIADDMGLGKTLQVITLLLKVHSAKSSDTPSLVVCPTTLIGNWVKECAKFAPSLRVSVYHGAERSLKTKGTDIVISSYGILRRDLKKFNKHDWNLFIIDEAQNIKNTETQQTKAIKSLKAKNFIAMSGTPVENRLSELWSIFDFINPGYMKSLREFNDNFAIPIERYREVEVAEKLKNVSSPFLLRRLKTDKTIIKDLPEKVVIDEFNYLSKEQTAIYQNIVEANMAAIESSEGIERKGLIFKLITNLKQLCNHPSNYTKQKDYDPELSGKATKLISLLREILINKEKIIIFTQYTEMGDILQEMISKELLQQALFFHGGISRKKRDQMVEDFQNKPENKIIIISLKAGGTGLNLTAANHVIHYDLWWNPAVENQATDRAFRIGQTKNVFVHRFVSLGTFEEKINDIIKNKQELVNLTVSTGENWISEMSDKDLKKLFAI
ncbi:MAG: DEAD/DEAH box helicase [Proteobacteria bacterium]|nr:DEAD/DEAH box helicase [Pseudomonadota bacterium]